MSEDSRIIRVLGKKGRTTIPFLYRRILGIGYNTVLSFTLDGDRIIVKGEKLCDNCKNSKAEKNDLEKIINSLSTEEQYQALALLSTSITKEHGAKENNI